MMAHYIISDEDKPDLMFVSYAAAKSIIKEPVNLQTQQKACELVERCVQQTINPLKIDESDKQALLASLKQQGTDAMQQYIQQNC